MDHWLLRLGLVSSLSSSVVTVVLVALFGFWPGTAICLPVVVVMGVVYGWVYALRRGSDG